MFKLTVMDNDKWIAEGISQYFSDRHIRVRAITDMQATEPLDLTSESDIIISELCTPARDVQAISELFVMVRKISPATRLIFLTDLNEKAVIQYVTTLLPGARFLSKRCDIHCLANEVFSFASGEYEEIESLIVKRQSDALTAREFGLLRHLASQKSLTAIAYKLNLSVKTISQHRKNIMRKLNCRTVSELSPLLARMGYGIKKDSVSLR